MNTRKRILSLSLLAMVAGCATAVTAPVKQISYDAVFETVDLSADGIITIDEFEKHFPDSKGTIFLEGDADKDGRIYPDEWYQFREKKGYMNP